MKHVVNILLLLLMVSHTTKTIVTFVSFKWNQEYIATTHCENKQKPTLECDGKCYLKKQIKQQQESEESPLVAKKGQFFDCFIKQESKPLAFSSFLAPIKAVQLMGVLFIEASELQARLLVTKLLRPPTCF
ncbi:MAG: Unknown protein [uncultured Aureispira sp.]|uniref:Uncharacterized protein n=1 Tax=uncultured Aureispira sp. TaxID=1331704 RepID=A0A6S6S7N7_9BACT|nr:MAG: Unknown protein [uncultured Aureispira sp.]